MFDHEPLMQLAIDVGPPQDFGEIGGVIRRCVPIIGGTVSGALEGEVLSGGADWQLIAPDGSVDIAARYALRLTGGLVEVESKGVRHASPEVQERIRKGEPVTPDDVYFRTAIRFRTSAPDLTYLNTLLAISRGFRPAQQLMLTLYRVP